jgi:hypothetical protein
MWMTSILQVLQIFQVLAVMLPAGGQSASLIVIFSYADESSYYAVSELHDFLTEPPLYSRQWVIADLLKDVPEGMISKEGIFTPVPFPEMFPPSSMPRDEMTWHVVNSLRPVLTQRMGGKDSAYPKSMAQIGNLDFFFPVQIVADASSDECRASGCSIAIWLKDIGFANSNRGYTKICDSFAVDGKSTALLRDLPERKGTWDMEYGQLIDYPPSSKRWELALEGPKLSFRVSKYEFSFRCDFEHEQDGLCKVIKGTLKNFEKLTWLHGASPHGYSFGPQEACSGKG